MSESQWLGNDVWDAAICHDPLFDPRFDWPGAHMALEPHNHEENQRCGGDCPSTPIYAIVYADVGLPDVWGWRHLENPIFSQCSVNEVTWTLPDYSYPDDPFDPTDWKTSPGWAAYLNSGPDDPPWVTRQENPEK